MDPPEEIEGMPLRFDMPSHSSFSIEQEDEETARNVSMAYRRKVRALWSCVVVTDFSYTYTRLLLCIYTNRDLHSAKSGY